MPVILDTFPAPALDSERWTSVVQGAGVSYTVNNLVDVLGVDAVGDSLEIHSSEKLSVPGGQDFEVEIEYGDIVWVDGVVLSHYLGWRTYREDEHGNPYAGMDVMVVARPGPGLFFERRSWSNGVEQRGVLFQENELIEGKVKIERIQNRYRLWYFKEEWLLLEEITLPTAEIGFLSFGVFAEQEGLEVPWIGSS